MVCLRVLPPVLLLLAAFAPGCVYAKTVQSDVIGLYVLDEDTARVGTTKNCQINLTVNNFVFDVREAPQQLFAPSQFNMLIGHRVTKVANRPCQSDGYITAVDSAHPFATDVAGVLDSWAKGGWGFRARWIPDDFLDEVSQQSFVVGYDVNERTCDELVLKAGIGYMWFQPGWNLLIGDGFQLKRGIKYLLMTFQGQPAAACVYRAVQVGGQGNFPPGPVSDPSFEENGGVPTNVPSTTTPVTTTAVTTTAEVVVTPTPDVESDQGEEEEEEGEEEEEEGDEEEEEQEEEEEGEEEDDEGGNVFAPPDDLPPEDEPACFPGDAVVSDTHGNSVELNQVSVGHQVHVGEQQFSDIYFFSHRETEQYYEYVQLTTASKAQIALSEGHYIPIHTSSGKVLKAAGAIQVGDTVTLSSGERSDVTQIGKVRRKGRYAPHTLHGEIVIDGIVASTYTTAVHPRLARNLLRPVRWLYRAGWVSGVETVLHQGKDWMRRAVPGGGKVVRIGEVI